MLCSGLPSSYQGGTTRQEILDSGSNALVRTVEEVRWDETVAAKGIIIGTPVRFRRRRWTTLSPQRYYARITGPVIEA